jgi:hypothetical protein
LLPDSHATCESLAAEEIVDLIAVDKALRLSGQRPWTQRYAPRLRTSTCIRLSF